MSDEPLYPADWRKTVGHRTALAPEDYAQRLEEVAASWDGVNDLHAAGLRAKATRARATAQRLASTP